MGVNRTVFLVVVCWWSFSCQGYMYDKECVADIGVTFQLQDRTTQCDRVEVLFRAAQETISPSIIPEKDFYDTYHGITIMVLGVDDFIMASADEPAGVKVAGWYDFVTGIVMSKDGCSLAHEMLHLWDAAHFAAGTAQHLNWDSNGYYTAIKPFQLACSSDIYLLESKYTVKNRLTK